jgi:hypothetical protein
VGSNPEKGVVQGVFDSEEHAAEAVQKLIEAHYDPRHEINLVASHRREHENVPIFEKMKFGRNAAIGAAIGAVLAFVGVYIAGLTVGPFTMIAAGPVVAALEAAFGGGCLGFALGALQSLEMMKQEPSFETAHVHDGVVMVGVTAKGERGERARHILQLAGARHFTS